MMDEQLIYLEPDEEITAIIDRLRLTDARALRLIVPKGALVLQSLVSLKLLARAAAAEKKEIALVSSDRIAQRLAREAGLVVYRKPKDSLAVYPEDRRQETEDRRQETEELPEGIPVHRYDTDDGGRRTEDRGQKTEDGGGVPENELRETDDGLQTTDYSDHGGGRGKLNVPRMPRRLIMGLLSFVGLGILGTIAFMEFVPRATIDLVLETEPLEQAVLVKAATELAEPDLANARIPAQAKEVSATIEREAPATGKKQVGDQATASLTLYNYWDSNPQTIDATGKFRAGDGTIFVATTAATIPGATTTLSQGRVVTTPGTTTLIVAAETAGTEANGKSGRLTIPGLPASRQDKIYGETNNPSAGGTSREITIVTAADLDTLKNATREALLADGKTKLAEGNNGRLLDGAVSLAITSEEPSAAAGDEADTLRLKMDGTVKGLIIQDDHLKTATVAILERTVPSGRTLVLRDNDSLVAAAERLDLAAGTFEVRVTVKTRTALALDAAAAAESVTGLVIPEAEGRLRVTAGIAAVTIENRPRWLKNLPKRPGQIEIKTEYAEE